ncbi:MAG: DUF4367 domain-containing protein [Clostridia bacterium]|nr:DUF4367 domain-containing protein [Clostridia bacterium]
MNNNERELFKKALSEAMAQKYDEELAECEENAVCSQKHYDKMQKIIGRNVYRPKKKLSKKALIAIIVAAALLLTGCTVAYIYRDEIRDFVEEIYDEFIGITYDDGQHNPSEGITEPYELAYVPKGYEKINEQIRKISVYYIYENTDGDTISFRQNTLDYNIYGFDIEEGYTTIFTYGEIEVYCRFFDTSYHYLWNDGKYALNINSTKILSEDDLVKIIENIVVKN